MVAGGRKTKVGDTILRRRIQGDILGDIAGGVGLTSRSSGRTDGAEERHWEGGFGEGGWGNRSKCRVVITTIIINIIYIRQLSSPPANITNRTMVRYYNTYIRPGRTDGGSRWSEWECRLRGADCQLTSVSAGSRECRV